MVGVDDVHAYFFPLLYLIKDSQRLSQSEDELCDIKEVTGQYPAVVSFDLRDLNHKYLLTIAWLIRKAYERGLIITLSWHQHNPVSGTSAYIRDHSGESIQHIIARILENGDLNAVYKKKLDTVADWLRNVTDSNGRQIPILFRPYHEMNGGWFWWGTNHATSNKAADFKHLFQYTVRYLRDSKQIHNLLYAFSPSKPSSLQDYYHFYPGDGYVDLVGMDYYYTRPFSPNTDNFLTSVHVVTEVATAHDKLAAITEVGIQNNGIEKHHNFWMDHVLSPLKSGNGTTKVAYMLTWTNNCLNGYTIFVPYHRHAAASKFMKFQNDSVMVFGPVMHNTNQIIVG
ncbi:mannan endo-1,4-beta-mannosidase-like [Mercenaria mercenaria]|uniref:mannan endo-1,4-beta-mannosidase-like n=1 Tax=Mercenaria mercenaria TaxID=6596 RepID=UPI00234EFE19|nr:mannan endo-1,4-beta-mannosidase-like [Mercenaria mercenaria]